MRSLSVIVFWAGLIQLCLSLDGCASAAQPADPHPDVDFRQQIEPLLSRSCYSCHGSQTQESGLRLDVKQRAFEGGDSGAAIVVGKGSESRLVRVAAGEDEDYGRMPPEGEGTPLTDSEVALLQAWIDQGAPWPDSAAGDGIRSDHWSFQPIERPAIPPVSDPHRVRNPIDAFILARLKQAEIEPSPEADRATLIRRVHLDLLGLPPAPAEVTALLNDPDPGAYERLVDRLLDSPHYGERWGRHWLDLARYADSDGYEKDNARPFAWRYRQWVIDALNADMPLDQFSIEQIAGDLLPDAGPAQQIATGFHRNTLHNTEGGVDREEDRFKKTVDRTNTLGTIWLGLTIDCAQCHSHKYDPITQREYYSLFGFFDSIDEVDLQVPLPDEPPIGERADVQADRGTPSESRALAVAQTARPRQTRVHLRGEFLTPGEAVQAGVPGVLPPLAPRGDSPDRLDLARWLFVPENPLTARVAVNGIWQRYFGQGIVASVDDFGSQGELPTHPELLDWLACELRDGGWSLKHLHRLIATSATYRQSSTTRADLQAIDPENRLLARQSRRRVEAEIVRDLALSVGGLLEPRVGGPSVRPPQPAEHSQLTYANSARWQTSSGGDRYRRGLYTFFQRTSPYPLLMTFDAPDSTLCTAARSQSNTPLQALTLWNDAVFFECAQSLARRIWGESPSADDAPAALAARARYAFLLCLGRQPSTAELNTVGSFYETQLEICRRDAAAVEALCGPSPLPAGAHPAELAAWVLVGRALLNLDEFITRE